MTNWRRQADPAFYGKEPYVLRSHAEIPRYADDAQLAVRLDVLRADWSLYAVVAVVAVSAYLLAMLPLVWTPVDTAIAAVSAFVAALLFRVHGRRRTMLASVAIGILFAIHAHPFSVAPLVGMVAAGATLVGSAIVVREWRAQPQMITWSVLAALLLVCAYTMTFNTPAIARHLPAYLAIMAVAFLGACAVAGRIRRAELLARPEGVLSLPQSIVPLLERSHDHAVICWFV